MANKRGPYTKEPGEYVCLTFATTLRAVRRSEFFVSQAELAKMIGALGEEPSASTVSKWESGHKYPPDRMRPQLARLLRMSLTSLFGDYDQKYRDAAEKATA